MLKYLFNLHQMGYSKNTILRIVQYAECGKQSQEADEYVKDWYADQRRRLSEGLNAALRGVAKTLYNELGDKVTIYGIQGRLPRFDRGRLPRNAAEDFSDILTVGGTILGTSRQPFKEMRKTIEDSEETKLDKMLHTVKKAGFDCLVILGGNGTHKTANLLSMKGVNVVTLPKTIDNDLWGTELTFGFQSAIDIASTVIDSIHSTAFSHSRVFIVEVMGHKAAG